MKPKEYVTKYYLDTANGVNRLNHNDFVSDLTIDFMTLLEVGKANQNIKGFDNAVRAIRMKWDAINNKTVGELPIKLWNYFYATIVVKLKYKLFPTVMKQRDEEREQRKREYEERRREYNFFDSWFQNAFFYDILSRMFTATIPTDSFNALGLESNASEDDIKTAYRELSFKHHPDKGGSHDIFIAITEAKNKCLMYLKKKS